jgi:hypothetical protein
MTRRSISEFASCSWRPREPKSTTHQARADSSGGSSRDQGAGRLGACARARLLTAPIAAIALALATLTRSSRIVRSRPAHEAIGPSSRHGVCSWGGPAVLRSHLRWRLLRRRGCLDGSRAGGSLTRIWNPAASTSRCDGATRRPWQQVDLGGDRGHLRYPHSPLTATPSAGYGGRVCPIGAASRDAGDDATVAASRALGQRPRRRAGAAA